MKFSQRIGLTPIKTELEKYGLSTELRNSLWTLVLELIINSKSNDINYDNQTGRVETYSKLAQYFRELWIYFFKRPIDNLPMRGSSSVRKSDATRILRDWYFKADWSDVFDFIEFSSGYCKGFDEICNGFLKEEFSAYRFIDGKLVEVNSQEEIIEIQNAIANSDKFKSVKTHLTSALDLLSERKKPDYRNSIKESISAVESICKIIIKNDKSTLGQALKEIEKTHQVPQSLKAAFSSLYGYTSGEGGIRHSLLELDIKVDIEEARFMLVACSAFINYLMAKI